MKAVILAGGYGTRIAEETTVRPKPMVEIGGRPILWHIMKIYAAHGVDEFVICCGYKSHVIKEYFANYYLRHCDVTFDLPTNSFTTHLNGVEPWKVSLIETGEDTMTGGRLKRVRDYIGSGTFFFTYGDCVSDVDVSAVLEHHRRAGVLATLTAIQPAGRFGSLTLAPGDSKIARFEEKPDGDGGWVNGGFFVLEPEVIDYIPGDDTSWEREPLEQLANEGKLAAYKHHGFWYPMDTIQDKVMLEREWDSGSPPWKVW